MSEELIHKVVPTGCRIKENEKKKRKTIAGCIVC